MDNSSALTQARTERQRFWVEHLNACQEQKLSLKAYARAHGLSVSALYAAKSACKRRDKLSQGGVPTPKLVPVRLAPTASMVRVLLSNGVVVEFPESIDPQRCQALLISASALP